MGVAISYIFLLLVLSLRFFSGAREERVVQGATTLVPRPLEEVAGFMGKCCGKWISSPSKMDQHGGIIRDVCEKYHL